MKTLQRIKSVYRYSGHVSGQMRIPKVSYVAGDKNPVTVHRENGCLYKLDVQRMMFSKGNILERGRLPKLVKPEEVIVDMFAGIGYFSIPLGKFSPAKKIYSIELNPNSFRFLKNNIKLNKLSGKVEPIQGDCRTVQIPEKADRVLMGHLPKTYEFLPAAFKFLKPNGIIHYHDTFRKEELWEKTEKILREYSGKHGFYPIRMEKRVVKQYAPGIFHVVIDAEFRKA
ncbi:MAG: class I SAM-dependent methyltransferase family protein [Candidatus Aenigmarchaeota archaeon]|nr:class I SAM-dependent methyltransferase family protein [Candidatus Aenigmarchaeota archaeon]